MGRAKVDRNRGKEEDADSGDGSGTGRDRSAGGGKANGITNQTDGKLTTEDINQYKVPPPSPPALLPPQLLFLPTNPSPPLTRRYGTISKAPPVSTERQ